MADFLNGDIFGYLLHAAEVLIALALFTVGLKRRRLFPLRVVVVCLLYLALAVGLGLLFERYFPVIRYLCAFLLSLTLIPLCYRVELWDGLQAARPHHQEQSPLMRKVRHPLLLYGRRRKALLHVGGGYLFAVRQRAG